MSGDFQLGPPEIKAVLLAVAIIGAVATVRYRWWTAVARTKVASDDNQRPPSR